MNDDGQPITPEQALRESEERFRALFNNIVDGLVVIDEGGTIIEFSKAAERIFEYTADEVIGGSVNILMPEPDRGRHDGYIANYLHTGEARIIGYGREVIGQRKSGETFAVDLAVNEMPRGGKRYFVGIVRDISERKAIEQQLRQAYKMEALGQLTGGVAHDFNNLLAVLMMDLELLDELTEGQEEQNELVREAREVAQTGADLTQRLLAFSRRQALEPRVVNLNELIAGTAGLLRRTLGEQIEIDTVGPSDLWDTLADPAELENALLNLALNARDAMQEGGRLTIETANEYLDEGYAENRPELAAGDYVLMAVTDTGTGMPPEVVEKVFDPFFTTKDAASGSGLGLSMVYGFAKQSNGHVSVYSEPGHGTTVNLFLPRAPSDAERSAAAPTVRVEQAHGDETVLLVEDHPQLRNRAVAVLGELGYRVIASADGNEALAHLEGDGQIDLLFTDVVMPGGLNGPELAEKARALRPGLNVLFTTGYAEHALLREGLLENGGSLLRKPYTRRTLAEKIRQILDTDE